MKDVAAHRSLAAPAVEGRPGVPGRAVGEDPDSGARLEVELAVDDAAGLAVCAGTVKKGGLLIASDAAKLPIR